MQSCDSHMMHVMFSASCCGGWGGAMVAIVSEIKTYPRARGSEEGRFKGL